MLVKKGWKKNRWKVMWKNYVSSITFPVTLKKPGGLKKKKQQKLEKLRKQKLSEIPQISLPPPAGNIFWFDPI